MNQHKNPMTLEQLLKHDAIINDQITNDANQQLETSLITNETAQFRQSITPYHQLFAVTLTPKLKHLIDLELRKSKSDCTTYIQNLVTELLHLFHKTCCNNYTRDQAKMTPFFAPVEYTNKEHSESVTPHTHACFAIHPDYQSIFESLLIPHSNPNVRTPPSQQHTIDFKQFKNEASAVDLESKIASLHVVHLQNADIMDWSKYCFKEQTHSLQLKKREKCL